MSKPFTPTPHELAAQAADRLGLLVRAVADPQPPYQPQWVGEVSSLNTDRPEWVCQKPGKFFPYLDWKRIPPYQPGEVLWFQEEWQDYCPMWQGYWCGHGSQEGIEKDHRPVYRADPRERWLRGPEGKQSPPTNWRSADTMPEWAARYRRTIARVEEKQLRKLTRKEWARTGLVENTTIPVRQLVNEIASAWNEQNPEPYSPETWAWLFWLKGE